MKKHAVTLALLIIGIFVVAQTSEKKAVFNVVKPDNFFAVSPTKMNVFYIGLDNPIDVAICGVPAKYITATIDSGIIEKIEDGKFNVRVKGGMCETKINIFTVNNGKTVKIGEQKFRIKRVPDPIAYIGGVKSGIIDKSSLLAVSGIIPKMDNFDFDLNFKIVSYTFLIKQGTDIIPTAVQGGCIPDIVKSKLMRAAPGTRVYFEDIKAVGPDGTIRTLSPIILQLI